MSDPDDLRIDVQYQPNCPECGNLIVDDMWCCDGEEEPEVDEDFKAAYGVRIDKREEDARSDMLRMIIERDGE